MASTPQGAPERQYEGERVTQYGIKVVDTTPEAVAYTNQLAYGLANIQPGPGMRTLKDVERAVKAAREQAEAVSGIKGSDLPDSNRLVGRAMVRDVVEAVWSQSNEEGLPSPRDVGASAMHILGQAAKPKRIDAVLEKQIVQREVKRRSDDAVKAKVAEARLATAQGIIVGAQGNAPNQRNPIPEPPSAVPEPLTRKDRDALNVKLLTGDGWGLNDTVARRLVKSGFDPRQKHEVIDARLWGLNRPSVENLIAQGRKVQNIKGITGNVQKAGYTDAELKRGKEASFNTATGGSRAEGQAGLFRNKRIYNADGTFVDVAPKYKIGNAGKFIKSNTTGAVKRSIESRSNAREEKRLNNPLYRISKVENMQRDRQLVQLENEIANSSGFTRWYKLRQMSWMKWSLITKGWVTFLLLAGMLFVPWVGLLEWAGWAMAAVASGVLKAGAFVLVNAYNLIAGIIVGAISVVGNAVVGFFEWASSWFISDLYGLTDAKNCSTDEVCKKRLFQYEVTKVDVSFPGWPALAKPKSFNGQPFLDTVLRLFGIKWSLANEVRRIFFGGQ